jgi:DNA-binding NarL/FixJ family response regulator
MSETPPMSLRPGVPSRDRIRIVVADDDWMFARLLQVRLSAHPDLEVVGIAGNGSEAVALAEELEPDIVLMDVSMPVLDGVEATRLIRALPEPPTVVLVTGEDDDADLGAYEAGAAAYLRKSLDLVSLIDVIVAFSQFAGARA